MIRFAIAAAVGAVVLAGGGSAEACRYAGNQRVLLEQKPPSFAKPRDLILLVRVKSVNTHFRAEAEVLRILQGRPGGRIVRVVVNYSGACGPTATPGEVGFLTGRMRREPDGVVLVPRTRTLDGRLVDP